jgi:hypothetical protein
MALSFGEENMPSGKNYDKWQSAIWQKLLPHGTALSGCLVSQRFQALKNGAPRIRPIFSREFAHDLRYILQILIDHHLGGICSLQEKKQFSVHRPVVIIGHALNPIPQPVGKTNDDFIEEAAGALITHAKRIQAALNQINIGQWPYTQAALCSFFILKRALPSAYGAMK